MSNNNPLSKTFISIGFGNIINADKVVTVMALPGSAAVKVLAAAKEKNTAIDATAGRKTRTILIMDNGFVVMSGINSGTILDRLNGKEDKDE